MNVTRSLNVLVPWKQVLELLELPLPRSQALPAGTACPSCQGQLTILPDLALGGQWHWCRSCGQCGDMLELVARTWKLSVPATIARMQDRGVEIKCNAEQAQRYVTDHVERRQRHRELWAKAHVSLFQQNLDIKAALTKQRLVSHVPLNRWHEGPGRLLGGISSGDVTTCLHPKSVLHGEGRRHTRPHSPSSQRPFKGEGWRDVLCLPFYDLPGRISTFVFLGRKGRPDRDVVIRELFVWSEEARETGVAFHPELFSVARGWERTIVAVPDPLVALRMQLRHYEHDTRSLPLLGWLSDRVRTTRYSWNMFHSYQLVFWMPAFDPDVLHQAVHCRALVSTVGPNEGSGITLSDYMSELPPRDLTKRIIDTARPWSAVVAQNIKDGREGRIEELFWRLKLSGYKAEEVLQQCSEKLRARVIAVLGESEEGRSVMINGRTIVEHPDGWYVQHRSGAEELICDALLRVDAVINHQRTGEVYYRGRIVHKDEETEFCEAKTKLAKPLAWMDQFLTSRGKGVLTYNPSWNSRALSIAFQFNAPQTKTGIDAIGWDNNAQEFVFPEYRIARNGDVLPLNEHYAFPGDSPAHLPARTSVSAEELDRISEGSWSIWLAAIANVIAPVFEHDPVAVGLTGAGALLAGKGVCAAMGCLQKPAPRATTLDQLLAAELEHRWPLYVDAGTRITPTLQEWLYPPADQPRNVLAPVNEWAATVFQLLGLWRIVVLDHAKAPSQTEQEAIAALTVAYLQDLCQRQLRLSAANSKSPESWCHEVYEDVYDFLKRSYGPYKALRRAFSALRPELHYGSAEAFVRLTGRLKRENRWEAVPAGFESGKAVFTRYLEGTPALGVPKGLILDALATRQVVVGEPGAITAVLQRAGKLVEDRADAWVVDEAWWLELDRRDQNDKTQKLRVKG